MVGTVFHQIDMDMKRYFLYFPLMLSIFLLSGKGLMGQDGDKKADDKDALPYQVEEIHQLVMEAHEKPENADEYVREWADEHSFPIEGDEAQRREWIRSEEEKIEELLIQRKEVVDERRDR